MAVNVDSEAQVVQRADEAVVPVFATEAQLKLLPTANNPDWTKGQAIAALIGGSAAFDQAFKWYAWDPDSTTSDNGTTVLKPDAIEVDATLNATGRGRWRSP